jgi:cyclopropane-fatty-acyl-phospholipid synthase
MSFPESNSHSPSNHWQAAVEAESTGMSNIATSMAIGWTEGGLLPDVVIRGGIRALLRRRLAGLHLDDCEARSQYIERFVGAMNSGPVAPVPHKANEQHYEVPAEFFRHVLGKHRKYSSCYWGSDTADLDRAESAALALTCHRAEIRPGMRILDLGCGWGSLSLWMARHFPDCRILAVTNSHSQREYIMQEALEQKLKNLRVMVRDMNELALDERFDRVVSVEMFEHMRNYGELMGRIHDWLEPGGRFFMHIFCHRVTPYEFLEDGPSDWMTRHFFAGGIMPSDELPLRFQDSLRLVQRWRWDGRHYERTANAWLARLDANRKAVEEILARTYGAEDASLWMQRWRVFFMACAELFGFDDGQQWWVSHYLFERAGGDGRGAR